MVDNQQFIIKIKTSDVKDLELLVSNRDTVHDLRQSIKKMLAIDLQVKNNFTNSSNNFSIPRVFTCQIYYTLALIRSAKEYTFGIAWKTVRPAIQNVGRFQHYSGLLRSRRYYKCS